MERIRLLDLARGFTVLFIPAIHTGMLFSDISVHSTLLGRFLIFIAEGPGGQLLMLLMGLSFSLKTHHSTISVCIKAFCLVLAGYLLNILKFVVLYSLNILPGEVLTQLQATGTNTLWKLIGMGDILHFSGLALLVLHGLYRLRNYHIASLLIALLIIFVSPLLWDSRSIIIEWDYVLQLFTGQPPEVFFPLFPWVVYPVIGLAIGYYFKSNRTRTMVACGIIGTLLTVGGFLGEYLYQVQYLAGFYRTPPAATMWHIGIVLLSIYIWHLLDTYLQRNYFFQLLEFSSRHITSIYILQWVMICWYLPIFGFRQLDLFYSGIAMLAMTLNTYLLCLTFQLVKKQYGKSKNI